MRDADYQFIRTFVYRHSRINLGPDKQELVSARLGKRLRACRVASIGAYCELLQSPGGEEEVTHLIDAISTNHTYFFREEGHFAALREVILPQLLARRTRERWPALRVWSAACSTGEEPYSIAIALSQQLTAGANAWPWRIEATDISTRVLEKARRAIYPAEALSKMEPALVKSAFQVGHSDMEGFYRVQPRLQSTVNFRQLNLLEGAAPFSEPFHVIFCRNVMIYFDRATQEELIGRLSQMLVPGGFLMVGHSESLTAIKHPLKMIRPATYQAPGGRTS